MICPECGKTYYNGRMSCPFCGRAAQGTERAVPAGDGSAKARRPDGERRSGPISRPPLRSEGGAARAGAYRADPRNRKKKKQNGPKTGMVVIFIVAAVIIAAVAAMLMNGSLSKDGKNAVGDQFIELLLDGETDGAMQLLPYDPKDLYRDSMRAEFDADFGGDFSKFYAKYKPMGIVASDFDGFIETSYNKIASEFKLGFVSFANGGYSVTAKQESERVYEEVEVAAYREELRLAFERERVDISRYLKTELISDVSDVRYTVTVVSEGGNTQTAEISLTVLTYDGKRTVIPKNSGMFSAHDGFTGQWTFIEGGETFAVKFAGDGTGSVTYGERYLPLTYRLVGNDGMIVVCPAFGEGETVCRYSAEGDVLTLSFPDGDLTLDRVPD